MPVTRYDPYNAPGYTNAPSYQYSAPNFNNAPNYYNNGFPAAQRGGLPMDHPGYPRPPAITTIVNSPAAPAPPLTITAAPAFLPQSPATVPVAHRSGSPVPAEFGGANIPYGECI